MKLKFKKSETRNFIWSLNLFNWSSIVINPRYWGFGFTANFIKSRKDAPEVHPTNVYIQIHILCILFNMHINNPKYDKQISNDYWKKRFADDRVEYEKKKRQEIHDEKNKIVEDGNNSKQS